MCRYSIPNVARETASVSRSNCGLVRERGADRTSTTSRTNASFSNSMNTVTGLVACPIVKNFVEICFGIRIRNRCHPRRWGRQLFGIGCVLLPFRLVRPSISQYYCSWHQRLMGNRSMNADVADCVESDETILNADVPDDTLEPRSRRCRGPGDYVVVLHSRLVQLRVAAII